MVIYSRYQEEGLLEYVRQTTWVATALLFSYVAYKNNIPNCVPGNIAVGSLTSLVLSQTPIIKWPVNVVGLTIGMCLEQIVNGIKKLKRQPSEHSSNQIE